MNSVVIEWSHSFLLIFRGKSEFQKSTPILIMKFLYYNSAVPHSNIRYGHPLVICSALCALYISLKIFFQEMNAGPKVEDCIFVVFELFITMS